MNLLPRAFFVFSRTFFVYLGWDRLSEFQMSYVYMKFPTFCVLCQYEEYEECRKFASKSILRILTNFLRILTNFRRVLHIIEFFVFFIDMNLLPRAFFVFSRTFFVFFIELNSSYSS